MATHPSSAIHVTMMAIMMVMMCSGEQDISSNLKLQIRLQLKRLNNPAIKSFNSRDGDIIDCVHIMKQPAFDHPLLKNHTIQMWPSFLSENIVSKNMQNSNEESDMSHIWKEHGECPDNTIPIRRTRETDLLRFGSIENFGKKISTSIQPPKDSSSHETAVTGVRGKNIQGTKAILNVWNPYVQSHTEYSSSQIWVLTGMPDVNLNSLQTGWQVYPELYGDNRTRFFIYWANDLYKSSGCYNLHCPGFVQTSKEIPLGGAISPISIYESHQYDITLQISRDPKTKNWWLLFEGKALGYWPTTLFPLLSKGATELEWGGEILNDRTGSSHTETGMGSGHFAEEGWRRAAFIRNIEMSDESMRFHPPGDLRVSARQSGCYSVKISRYGDYGTHMYFGGPGKNPRCS